MVMTTTKYGRLLADTFGSTVTGAELYGKLRRLERRGQRLGLRLCNGPEFPSEEAREAEERAILDAAQKLLPNCAVILNLDPRGYSLKVSDEWVRAHHEAVGDWMQRDWGGYGLLAPEIKLPTIYEIKARVAEKTPYFFDAKSMRMFGQTMRSFGVFAVGERVFIRAKSTGNNWTTREFMGDRLGHVSDEEKKALGL